jgi:4-hydroxy-tetrahydrodipicolinate synthase
MFTHLSGVYAASVTPLNPDFSVDSASFPRLLDFLAGRGCHGALLFGTTGEGPSFSAAERVQAWRVAVDWRRAHPDFRLLGGTGTPSLAESIELTQAAFEIGLDGVIVLPPYYFRQVSDDGLFAWFSQVIQRAAPPGGAVFGYHIPGTSGVPLSFDLLARLKTAFPEQFAGIKDSSGNPDQAIQLGERFGKDLLVLNGTDRLFSLALENSAAGCITAMANLYSPDLRQAWESFHAGQTELQTQAQERLNTARLLLEKYPPFPPILKELLARRYDFPRWPVRPPLLPVAPELAERIDNEL